MNRDFLDSGLPMCLSGEESACHCRRCRRHRFNPWVRKIPGEGNGNPVQYSCLGNPMDRGTWWATVHRVPKSQTGLSLHAHRCCPGICGDSPEDMTPPAIWVLLQVDLF